MSRDPEGGNLSITATLHKYLYAGTDPVNYVDPRGRELFDYVIESNAAIPEAKLVSIYGCVSGAGFAAVSLVLTDHLDWRAGVGTLGATFGCVTLYYPEGPANALVQGIIDYTPKVNYLFCGLAMEAVVHDLNELVEGKGNAVVSLSDALGALVGCVGNRLGELVDSEGKVPLGSRISPFTCKSKQSRRRKGKRVHRLGGKGDEQHRYERFGLRNKCLPRECRNTQESLF